MVVTGSVVHCTFTYFCFILYLHAALHFAETVAVPRLLTDLCPGKTIHYNTVKISTKLKIIAPIYCMV